MEEVSKLVEVESGWTDQGDVEDWFGQRRLWRFALLEKRAGSGMASHLF